MNPVDEILTSVHDMLTKYEFKNPKYKGFTLQPTCAPSSEGLRFILIGEDNRTTGVVLWLLPAAFGNLEGDEYRTSKHTHPDDLPSRSLCRK